MNKISRSKEFSFNPKTAGGGLNQPPPRHFARPFRRAKFFDRAARWLFYFQVSRILWHHFRENRAYRYDAAGPFIHARQTENGSKTWFCVQSQCKWSFLILFIKIWYFHFHSLKSIHFSIIMLEKGSVIDFAKKNNKNKRSKKQRNT